MLDEQFNEQAKIAAMESGLTEDEAEDEVDEFNANHYDNARFCEDCGVRLNDDINCNDEFLDDYCNDCWKKSLKEIKRLKLLQKTNEEFMERRKFERKQRVNFTNGRQL